jgi:hypothetical protein
VIMTPVWWAPKSKLLTHRARISAQFERVFVQSLHCACVLDEFVRTQQRDASGTKLLEMFSDLLYIYS